MMRIVNAVLNVALAIVFSTLGVAHMANAGAIVAVNQSNQIFYFDSSSPGTTSSAVNISGLIAGDVLAGIDGRPSDGMLYGFARNGNVGNLYTINPLSGVATIVSTINTSISGDNFAVDFNPVADRLRLISDSGQNLRINVATGVATIDGSLSFAAGDPNAGVTPGVVAGAYTNSVANATSTLLYDIDLSTQSLLTQNPPNTGTLNTVANLGGIAFPETSFDIDGLTNTGYIVANGFELSTINLADGSFNFIGSINSGSGIVGIATNIAAVPEPTSVSLLALAVGGYVWRRRTVARRAKDSQ
jgi:hypothetical protein